MGVRVEVFNDWVETVLGKFFVVVVGRATCGIIVPDQGLNPGPRSESTESYHGTAREFPVLGSLNDRGMCSFNLRVIRKVIEKVFTRMRQLSRATWGLN